jgi:hypothetical protein
MLLAPGTSATLLCSLLFIFSASGAFAQRSAPPLSNAPPLTGLVIGNDGKPISAVITAVSAGRPVAGARTESGNDGSFAVAGIPDGKYQLCAVDKGGVYLDPCTWSSSPVTVTISAAKPISGYQLLLTKGIPLQVRVNDAGQILDATAAAPNQVPATLIVAVATLHHTMQPLPVVSKDNAGRTLQTVVPLNAAIQVKLFGKGFALADASGNALNPSLGASVPLQTSETQQPLAFTVTPVAAGVGTKPQ